MEIVKKVLCTLACTTVLVAVLALLLLVMVWLMQFALVQGIALLLFASGFLFLGYAMCEDIRNG